jgi:hypothetical protein
MEQFTVTFTPDKIQEVLSATVEAILKSSYGNPFKDCIERCLKEKDGEIKKFIDGVITETLNNPNFKTQIGEIMLTSMVQAAMKR